MKKNLSLIISALACCLTTLTHTFSIPKFYHGRIFLDEPHFAEKGLFSTDLTFAGGSKHFSAHNYKGHVEFSELIFQAYQNFNKGIFVHMYIPFGSIRITDIEPCNRLKSTPLKPKLPPCIKKTALYSPGLFAGWTLNYQDTTYLDYVDLTAEAGVLLNSPKNAVDVPFFPIGYSSKPGFAGAAYFSLGAYEWLTLGGYTQAISFQPATLWSAGGYIKFDHLIPKLSFIFAVCGDGQNKKIDHQSPLFEALYPWQMLSVYLSFDVDLATDERPWLPRLKALYAQPVAGFNILKAAMGGFSVGFDAQIIF